jgi:TonB family protein
MKFWKYMTMAIACGVALSYSLLAADAKLVHLASVPESQIVSRKQPMYPPDALAQKIQGAVKVSIIIDVNGHVVDAKAVSGSPMLGPAAAQAVRGWAFTPAVVGNSPVRVVTSVMINFAVDRAGRAMVTFPLSLAK